MTDTPHITTPGGLISAAFIEDIRQGRDQEREEEKK